MLERTRAVAVRALHQVSELALPFVDRAVGWNKRLDEHDFAASTGVHPQPEHAAEPAGELLEGLEANPGGAEVVRCVRVQMRECRGEGIGFAISCFRGRPQMPPMQRYLISRNSSRPYFDPSRPSPDSLTPPNGATSVEMRPVLMPTIPYSSASATRQIRPMSRP
jgi:hypothetical protein